MAVLLTRSLRDSTMEEHANDERQCPPSLGAFLPSLSSRTLPLSDRAPTSDPQAIADMESGEVIKPIIRY